MAITININTPDATININSSEDSGVAIPNQEPSKKTPKNSGPDFLITEATIKNIKCDHRDEDGNYDVTDIGVPGGGVYRCNICNALVDLKRPDDPHMIKVTCDHLWSVFQTMKANNTDENLKKEVLDPLGMSLYIIKEHMAKILSAINYDVSTRLIRAQHSKTPPPYTTPNMANDPFFHNFPEFSQFFNSPSPEPDKKGTPPKKGTQPKKDEKPPTKQPRQQTTPFPE